LHQLAELERDCRAAYAGFQFSRVHQAVQKFCVVDLSNYYLDVCKDRLYIEGADAFPRRSAQTVLHHLARVLVGVLAPILPHTAEDAWRSLPFDTPAVSVFEAGWPESPAEWTAPAGSSELALWGEVRTLRGAVNSSLEAARTAKLIGSSLEARVEIHVADADLAGRLRDLCGRAGRPGEGNGVDGLANVFLVSQAEVLDTEPEGEHALVHDLEGLGRVVVGVRPARGSKCDRCWHFSEDVGAAERHPLLCERCISVVDAMGIVKQPEGETPALVYKEKRSG
jgi:isoleucyl-tRNA synthetase